MENIIDNRLVDYLFCKICRKALKKNKSTMFNDEFYNYLNENIGYMTIKKWSKDSKKVEIIHKQFGDILKQRDTMGKCYYFALLLARNFPNCNLVRGELRKLNAYDHEEGTREDFIHSWVEINTSKGNFVIDTTSRQIFDKDFYYEKFDACPSDIFSHGQLLNDELFFNLGVYSTNWRHELCEDFAILTLDYYNKHTNLCKDIINKQDVYNATKLTLLDTFKKMQSIEKSEIYDEDNSNNTATL